MFSGENLECKKRGTIIVCSPVMTAVSETVHKGALHTFPGPLPPPPDVLGLETTTKPKLLYIMLNRQFGCLLLVPPNLPPEPR